MAVLTLSLAPKQEAIGWLSLVPAMVVYCFDKLFLSVDMSPVYNNNVLCYKIELPRAGGIFTSHK